MYIIYNEELVKTNKNENNKIKTKQTRRVFIIRNMYIYLPPKIRQYIIALLYFFLLIHCILPLPITMYIYSPTF